MERFINHDSLAVLRSDLIDLIAGQSICISGGDFKKLTGDEITEFASGGRFMMGNLAESANCIIDTTDGIAIFTKGRRRVCGPVRPTVVRLETQAVDAR
jgi:hypothetical protein